MCKPLNNFTVILDCGHGGVDSQGVYTTSPRKMHTFPNKEVAYEGVYNRKIGSYIGAFLEKLGVAVSYTVQPDDATDISLYERVKHSKNFDKNNSLFLSLHSNASPKHNASGLELWTSKGKTKSDVIATYIGEELMSEFPKVNFRADYTDGDLDKESNFYVLKNTLCPAVLLENFFFDYYPDFELLRSKSVQKRLSWRISQGIIRYLKTIH